MFDTAWFFCSGETILRLERVALVAVLADPVSFPGQAMRMAGLATNLRTKSLAASLLVAAAVPTPRRPVQEWWPPPEPELKQMKQLTLKRMKIFAAAGAPSDIT